MPGIKGKSGGANNTKLTRGEKKVKTTISLAPTDKKDAQKIFGSVSKAVEWALKNKPSS